MRVKGIIVYVSNQPFMSDFNALQLEPARIRQMSLSNPTADGLSTPTTWQPPLPHDAPPPLPDFASTPTATASTPARTQFLYDDSIDPYQQYPVRRLANDPSFSTPTSTRSTDPSFVHTSPPYRQAYPMSQPQTPGSQQFTFGSQSPYYSPNLRAVMKSPTEYILAGVPVTTRMHRASSASAITLSCDESGQQYRSLQEAAAARRSELENIFSAYGMIYPFLPVDRDLTELPLTFTNPFFSVNEKLYHQVERILKYFRNCAQQRDGAFRLDRLGELAYQDGRCDLYHQHASTLLEALRAVDLLKVVTANAAGNFVLTIDESSTSLPRQTLNEIMDDMMHNSYVLIGSVTPMSTVSWEYIKCTPRNVVTTMTAMQLIKMTTALLDSLTRFLHRDTLRAITGDITSGLHRSIDPTLMEIVRKLLLYEETEWKHALRRQYLRRSMFH